MKLQIRRVSRWHIRISISLGDLTVTIDYHTTLGLADKEEDSAASSIIGRERKYA